MAEEFIAFSTPVISQATIAEVVTCLKSGWLATGPRVKQFEEDLKKYLHAPYAVALMHATAGLQLSLECLGIQEGDEVITTPFTFVATLNTIVHNRATPVLVDIDPITYNIDVTQIEAAITPRTRAIMPVHFAGLPADLDPIYKLAAHYNLRVIEDAAQAIGSYYKGKIIGSFGDLQVFSFHPNKVMTTGEGGCVTLRDAALARAINVMRFHGIDRDAWNRYAKGGSVHYDVIQPGYKYNMMDLQAAIGLHQLQELEGFIQLRTQLAMRYHEMLADVAALTLPQAPKYDHRNCWYLYAPLVNSEICGFSRDEFMQKMSALNIGTAYHYQAAHLYTFYRERFGWKVGQFPHAENVAARIVSLPLGAHLSLAQQERVVTVIRKIFGV